VIVVDTNVIAYLVLRNETAAVADSVLEIDPTWAAPKLWQSEMRNVLALYVRQELLQLEDAIGAMNKAIRVIADNEYDVESHRVLELARSSGCTAYDCEFVYVAEKLNVPLVTSDKKLISAFPLVAVSMADFLADS
jgi:predicted nucleic acid-binding protein